MDKVSQSAKSKVNLGRNWIFKKELPGTAENLNEKKVYLNG